MSRDQTKARVDRLTHAVRERLRDIGVPCRAIWSESRSEGSFIIFAVDDRWRVVGVSGLDDCLGDHPTTMYQLADTYAVTVASRFSHRAHLERARPFLSRVLTAIDRKIAKALGRRRPKDVIFSC